MKNETSQDPILAIDFGTSNSLVGCVYRSEKLLALPIDDLNADPTLMRTLLYFPDPDTCYYGQKAIDMFIENDMEGRLFRSFKTHLPNQAYLGTMFNNRVLSLENIIGLFLLELKKRAEKHLGVKVEKAVLGRPARYSMDEIADGFAIHRMEKAARFAGFKQIQFVPEPLAAAFDYRRQTKDEKIILIGDFGGGTSDFTIMKIHPKEFKKEDVLSIEGAPQAGDAFDSVFMSQKLNDYFGAKTKYRLPMGQNVMSMPPSVIMRLNHPAHIVHLKDKETYEFVREVRKCALRDKDVAAIDRLFVLIEDNQIFPFFESIEQSKKDLSQKPEAQFSFNYPDIEVYETFTNEEFEQWSLSVKQTIFEALDRALLEAQIKESDVDLVCVTGGTSKVPMIKRVFEERFGKEKLQTQTEFHSVTAGLVEVAEAWSQGKVIYPVSQL